MSEKLRNILTLALRPETGDGEATAAFQAARRLAAKNGLDSVLGSKTKTVYKDRVVTRDRLVYRSLTFNNAKTIRFKLTIPATYLHTVVERVFGFAYQEGVYIDVRSCTTKDGKIGGAAVFEMTLQGSETAVDRVDAEIDRCINIIKGRARVSDDECSYIPGYVKKRNLLVRLIKRIADSL